MIGDENFFYVKSNITPIFLGIICGNIAALIIRPLFRKLVFKKRKLTVNSLSISGIALSFIFLIIYYYLHITISFNIYSWIIIVISCVYLISYYIIRKKFFIDKIRKNEKIHFSDMVFSETKKNYLRIFQNRNTKLILKGKQQVSAEEFTLKIKKENKLSLRIFKYSKLITIALVIITSIPEILTGTIFDTVIFILAYSFVSFLIYKHWVKNMSRVEELKKELLDECDRLDVTLIDYLKNEEK